jgi:hypothetical protein
MAKRDQETETAGRVARLSLPLTDDGQVDWDRVRTSTKEKFLDVLRTDPEVRASYNEVHGIDADAPSLGDGLTEENVAAGLDIIANVNALVFRVAAARFVKHPLLRDQHGKPVPLVIDQDVLDAAFGLTPKQHAELDPRAKRLADKYSRDLPEWVKKNMDLYMFVSMFLGYTAQNAKTARQAQIKRDLHRAQTAFHTAKANQPQNPKPDTDAQPTNGHERTPPPSFAGDAMTNSVVDTPDTPASEGPTV